MAENSPGLAVSRDDLPLILVNAAGAGACNNRLDAIQEE
jgi:hypothetical protein